MSRKRTARPVTVLSRVGITLDDVGVGTTAERVWVQVAKSGTFKGYAGGSQGFAFDEGTFKQLITNFHRHPSYVLGTDGYGAADVIPWDFHHASEMEATEGTIPQDGAPAQGWIQELAVRLNGAEAELWALTRWLEPAKTYIREERYKWASVSVVFGAIDAVTGQNVGALLTSVALTNQPFIEGMQKLTADKKLKKLNAERYRSGMYVTQADSLSEAMESIRSLFQLPATASDVDVVAELSKLEAWSMNGGAPSGVDVDDLVGCLRTILNLPVLSTPEQVFEQVRLLGASLTNPGAATSTAATTTDSPAPVEPGTPQPPADSPAAQLERSDMDLKAMADKLGVVCSADAVANEVEKLVSLRETVAQSVGLEKTSSTKVVLAKAVDLTDEGVRAKYGAIFDALGVGDSSAALDKVASLLEQSAKLTEMAPEFSVLKQRQAEADAAMEEEEVEEAVDEMGIAASASQREGLKIALTALRKADPAKFAERFPRKAPGAKLSTASARAASPAVLASRITASAPAAGTVAGTEADGVDVSGYEGGNLINKTISYVKASVPGAQSWTWDQLHNRAVALTRSKAVRL